MNDLDRLSKDEIFILESGVSVSGEVMFAVIKSHSGKPTLNSNWRNHDGLEWKVINNNLMIDPPSRKYLDKIEFSFVIQITGIGHTKIPAAGSKLFLAN